MSEENICLDLAEKITDGIYLYYIPILIIVGSIGHFLSIYIPLRSSMRRSSASYYMVALALSDELVLINIAMKWLMPEFLVTLYLFPRVCAVFLYLQIFWRFLSAWFVVAFTVERFVAVHYPLQRQSICTVARAKLILIGITFIGIVVCSPLFWFIHEDCTIGTDIFFFRLLNTIVCFILPFTIIAIMNLLIIKSLKGHARIVNNLTTNKKNHDDDQGEHQENSSVSASHRKTTKMLLIISSVFLCLNLPFNVTALYVLNQAENINNWTNNSQRVFFTLHDFALFMDATSYGINFFLYCARGHEFRQAMYNTMVCRPRSWTFPKMYLYLRRIKIDTSKNSITSSKVSSLPKPEIDCEMLPLN